jgi:hypothetical protein
MAGMNLHSLASISSAPVFSAPSACSADIANVEVGIGFAGLSTSNLRSIGHHFLLTRRSRNIPTLLSVPCWNGYFHLDSTIQVSKLPKAT